MCVEYLEDDACYDNRSNKRHALYADYREYEREKRELDKLNLTTNEYEQRVKDLTDAYGI